MANKVDPLQGLNPDQSGPKEKIQNGDPRSSPNRDQRSGAREAGGPGPSLDSAEAGGKQGQVPPHDNLVLSDTSRPLPEGVDTSNSLPAGALDNAGRDMKSGELINPNRDQDKLQTGHTKVVGAGVDADEGGAAGDDKADGAFGTTKDVETDTDDEGKKTATVGGENLEQDEGNAAPAGKLKISGKSAKSKDDDK